MSKESALSMVSLFPEAGAFSSMFVLLGILATAVGIVDMIAFYLLLKMKRSGWIIVTAMGIISIALNLISFTAAGIISIALWVVILVYLFTKRRLFSID